ncbi:hypothetical protein Tco_0138423 [Tanacetum coccineum]
MYGQARGLLTTSEVVCFGCGSLGTEVGDELVCDATRQLEVFRADYGFVATMDREIRHDLERDVDYRITDTWAEMLVDMPGETTTDDIELGRRMTVGLCHAVLLYWGQRLSDYRLQGQRDRREDRAGDYELALAADPIETGHKFIEAPKSAERLQTLMTEVRESKGTH